ncbi:MULTISPECIES: hypothetical protein [unclassified Streptomyces]|jgi:hypothetical protein|uniref:hypothetical protein n=1 Tax=unclassified Streptomyces TaxID=2593676 RepID=UPI00367EE307
MESTRTGTGTEAGPGAEDPIGKVRVAAFAAVAIYLFGQAFDTYWHAKNVSFVPEPPSALWTIHLGIYLGAAIILATGALVAFRDGFRIAGGLFALGGAVALAGFFLDMWKHSQGTSVDFYHDLVWYGFGLVVVGMVRMEAMRRNRLGVPHRSD